MKKYIMGIDIGTSGCKSNIVDETGCIIDSYTVEYSLCTPKPGWSEQNPDDWWNAVVKSIVNLLKSSGIDKSLLAGVGLCGQMHGLVALDSNHNILRQAILWNDQRTMQQCKEITDKVGGLKELLKLTNNPQLPGYTAGKILWLRENEPEIYEKASVFLNPKDYIRYKLTGELATEVSDASGTGLFNVKNRCWSYELLSMLDIPLNLLPKVYESSDITGSVTRYASDITGLPENLPVVGGGGDAVIQTTGTGLIREGILGTTIGTSGIVAMALNAFKDNKDGRLQVFCNNTPDTWHVMGVTLCAGGAYRWYRDVFFKNEKKEASNKKFNIYELMDSEAVNSPPGSNNLIFLPYLTGERCPYADPYAKGSLIGLTLRHDRGDITRAIMEGVIYSLLHVYELIKMLDSNHKVTEIRVSGGGSVSNTWRQIHADIFQIPVKTVSGSSEGGAYGAALVAGVGCGIWNSIEEAVLNLKVQTENYPNHANKVKYEELYSLYKELYPNLKHVFDGLSFI